MNDSAFQREPLTGARWGLFMFGVAIVVAATAVVWILFAGVLAATDAWDPLGDFPDQDVTAVDYDGSGGTVTVVGTKCYDDAPVTVTGVVWWQSVDPAGTLIEVGRGEATRLEAECVTQTFENPIPPEVVAAENERGPIVWSLRGTETPIDEINARTGVPHTWRTEPFELVTTD